MRSVKLLAAMAVVAALVAGPVMAQDAMGGSDTTSTAPAKTTHKKHAKKTHHKKATSSSTAPASTPAQ